MSVKDEDVERVARAICEAPNMPRLWSGKEVAWAILSDAQQESVRDLARAALTALNLPELQEENKRMREALEKIASAQPGTLFHQDGSSEPATLPLLSQGAMFAIARAALSKQDENK